MGDENDGKSFLAKVSDVLKNLTTLITALAALATLVGGAWWYFSPPTPEILTFLIDPANITAGDTAKLSWYVSNADFIYINHGIGEVNNNSGSRDIEPDPTFTSYTITAQKRYKTTNKTFPISVQLKNLSLYYSPYKEMIVHEKYPFDVSVAMNDTESIKNARNEIRLKGNASHNKSVIETNPKGIGHKSTEIEIEGSRLTGANLTLKGEDKEAFNVTLIPPVDTFIFKQSSGQNYVAWHWDVVPQMTGPHTLIIAAGLNVENGKYMQLFNNTYIDVNVNLAVPAAAPAAVEKLANATKPANATAPAAKTPGFEGIFAIVGMIAIAHLVFGRKQ